MHVMSKPQKSVTTFHAPLTRENLQTLNLFAWCSPLATLMWLVGFLGLCGFAPPLSPAASATDIAAYYQAKPMMIQAGLCITMMGAAFMGPFFAGVTTLMRRIEGGNTPLADAQLGLGMLMILLFVIPCFLLGTAAFRPERDAQLIMLMNDAGWLPFVGAFQCTFIQVLCIGICILIHDKQDVLPRWLGFFNLWFAVLLMPAGFVLFFKSGPFAWDGVMAFWFVVVVFCIWYLTMFNEVRKAINRLAAEL